MRKLIPMLKKLVQQQHADGANKQQHPHFHYNRRNSHDHKKMRATQVTFDAA